MPIRAAAYFDGFNMYHALDALQQPMLKWLNLWAISERLLAEDENLARVLTCTALITDDVPKLLRHRAYRAALEAVGVESRRGHFADDIRTCRNCGAQRKIRVEKQGDVNLALSIIEDAYKDVFDVAYLVTADGDQAPTARMLAANFPKKRIITVAPPGRQHNKALLAECHGHRKISVSDLQLCLLPASIQGKEKLILRPADYTP